MRMQLVSHYRTPALTFCVVVAALLAGCASKNPLMDDAPVAGGPAKAVAASNSGVQTTSTNRFLHLFSPYKIDIQQGNFVSSEMLAQLKVGMTREQVRFVLGTPLLTDMFHADRWDYDFRLKKGNGEIISSRVSVFFDGNSLSKWEGGNLPTESEYLGFIAGTKPNLMPALSDHAPIAPNLTNK
jgi:outer membrane protein assembly factor BamE